jgi:hypothetical protein
MQSYDILVFGDLHAPYHHRPSWKLALKILDIIKPKVFRHIGDFADANAASRHTKDPTRQFLLKRELQVPIALRQELDNKLDKIGCTDKGITWGNHDMWANLRIREKLPELDGFFSIDKELGFTDNGWKTTEYGDYEKKGKLHLSHEFGYAGKGAAMDVAKELRHNSVFGHTHAAAVVYTGNAIGEKHSTMNVGWLGDPSKAKYMHRSKRNVSSMHGVGLIHVDSKGSVHQQFIPFIRNVAVVDRKEITL